MGAGRAAHGVHDGRHGQAEEAAPLVDRGLAVLRASGDDEQLWFGLALADRWLALTGDMAGSLVLSIEMLANARSRSHPADLAASLIRLAHTLVHLGRLDEVEPLLGEAEQLLPLVGDGVLEPSDIRGDLAAERGDWERAAAMYAHYALLVAQLPTSSPGSCGAPPSRSPSWERTTKRWSSRRPRTRSSTRSTKGSTTSGSPRTARS